MKINIHKILQAPSIILLLLWMIVPLGMTLYFSFQRYHLLYPERSGFAGLSNYDFFLTDPALGVSVLNTLTLVGGVIARSIPRARNYPNIVNFTFLHHANCECSYVEEHVYESSLWAVCIYQ